MDITVTTMSLYSSSSHVHYVVFVVFPFQNHRTLSRMADVALTAGCRPCRSDRSAPEFACSLEWTTTTTFLARRVTSATVWPSPLPSSSQRQYSCDRSRVNSIAGRADAGIEKIGHHRPLAVPQAHARSTTVWLVLLLLFAVLRCRCLYALIIVG